MNNNENYFILCEKCNCVPDVRIIEDIDTLINVKCSCAFEDTMRIKEFIQKMKKNAKSDVFDKDDCYNADMFSEQKISKIYKKLSIAKKEILTNANKIKIASIESLTRTRQKIEIAYQNYLTKTNDIFNFISILIHNYISLHNNITALRNVLTHSTFLVTNCASVDNASTVIDFFSRSKIIETSSEPLSLLPKKKNCIKAIQEKKSILKVYITNEKIFTYLSDNTLKIYNIDTYHCEVSLNVNLKGKVVDFLSNGDILTSLANKIFIYAIETDELKEKIVINVKDETYKAILLSKDIVALCTYGDHLKFFDVTSSKEIHSENNVREIISMIYSNALLIYATIESKIIFYEVTTHREIKTISKVICCQTESLFYINAQLIVGGANAITLIDETTKQIENCKFNGVTAISYHNEKIILGCMLGNLILFDLKNEKIEREIEKAHEGEIRMIKNTNGKLITVGSDNKIKFWNFNKQ